MPPSPRELTGKIMTWEIGCCAIPKGSPARSLTENLRLPRIHYVRQRPNAMLRTIAQQVDNVGCEARNSRREDAGLLQAGALVIVIQKIKKGERDIVGILRQSLGSRGAGGFGGLLQKRAGGEF